MHCEMIYEDDAVLVAYKPAGFPTQSGRIGAADMESELRNYLAKKGAGQPPYLGIVHRLDQPVEGLLVFAKTPSAAARLSKQLRNNTLHKAYYALVCGQPALQSATLVDYLEKKDNQAKVVTEAFKKDEAAAKNRHPAAKKAVLKYKTVQVKIPTTLLDIFIETGRFHQIRAQLAHAGYPILGDVKYGTTESLPPESLSGQNAAPFRHSLKGLALCAYRLSFVHPITGKPLDFTIQPKNQLFHEFF